jgi:hypothetical protein
MKKDTIIYRAELRTHTAFIPFILEWTSTRWLASAVCDDLIVDFRQSQTGETCMICVGNVALNYTHTPKTLMRERLPEYIRKAKSWVATNRETMDAVIDETMELYENERKKRDLDKVAIKK